MRYSEFDRLTEARILTPGKLDTPLRSNETIRVYHGTSKEIAKQLIAGFTGDTKADRKYSYERNNNPRGLFVSTSLETAKKFGPFVIEFHTLVSDLEPPAWPDGKFTTQGEKEKYFRDPEMRKQQQDQTRAKLSQGTDAIAQSDDPYLASILTDPSEPQALFVGNINPQAIRAVWASKDPKIDSRWVDFQRLSKKQFIKIYGATPNKDKLFLPRELPDFDEFVNKAIQTRHRNHTAQGFKDIIFNMSDRELANYLDMMLWNDKQKLKIINDIRKQMP